MVSARTGGGHSEDTLLTRKWGQRGTFVPRYCQSLLEKNLSSSNFGENISCIFELDNDNPVRKCFISFKLLEKYFFVIIILFIFTIGTNSLHNFHLRSYSKYEAK